MGQRVLRGCGSGGAGIRQFQGFFPPPPFRGAASPLARPPARSDSDSSAAVLSARAEPL